jgi:glycosyltransferase involved in cell wall biosynthesis
VIEHQRTGVLVPPDDPVALASQIVRLMSDPARAAGLGAAARAHASRFSFARMVAAFEEIYLAEWSDRVVAGAARQHAIAKS